MSEQFLLNPHYVEWLWIAGENGKPGVTADRTAAAEATRMITDPLVEVNGTNAASAGVSLNVEGGIDIVTAGADNDQMILLPHELANMCGFNTARLTLGSDRQAEFECALKMPSAITTMAVLCGFKTDDSPADLALTDTGLVCFNYNTDDSDTTWGVVSDIAAGGSDLDVDTGVTVTAGEVYHFAIKCDRVGVAHCYINGQEVTSVDFTAGADDWVPFIGIQSLDSTPSATPAMTVYGWRVSRRIGQAN